MLESFISGVGARDVNEARHYEAKDEARGSEAEAYRGRGRKVYRYGRVYDSCNYVTYFGYVI